jgi:hypothetical protein
MNQAGHDCDDDDDGDDCGEGNDGEEDDDPVGPLVDPSPKLA